MKHQYSPMENRPAHRFNSNHFPAKTVIVSGLFLILSAGLISVHAANTPDPATVPVANPTVQTAAPVTMEQKSNEPDPLQFSQSRACRRSPVWITPSGIVKTPHRVYAAVSWEKA